MLPHCCLFSLWSSWYPCLGLEPAPPVGCFFLPDQLGFSDCGVAHQWQLFLYPWPSGKTVGLEDSPLAPLLLPLFSLKWSPRELRWLSCTKPLIFKNYVCLLRVWAPAWTMFVYCACGPLHGWNCSSSPALWVLGMERRSLSLAP